MPAHFLIGVALAALGARGAPGDTLWLVAAEAAGDAVHAGDTEAELARRYGRANVRRDSLPGAEGETVYGSVLFPRDPRRTLYVYWVDGPPFRRVESVRPAPTATAWVVWPGLAVGTRLTDVERLNGRPFRLSGFEWDYGGLVSTWRGGRLQALLRERRDSLFVGVGFRPNGPTRRVSGEGEFSSALPAMRAADPRVGDLFVRVR